MKQYCPACEKWCDTYKNICPKCGVFLKSEKEHAKIVKSIQNSTDQEQILLEIKEFHKDSLKILGRIHQFIMLIQTIITIELVIIGISFIVSLFSAFGN